MKRGGLKEFYPRGSKKQYISSSLKLIPHRRVYYGSRRTRLSSCAHLATTPPLLQQDPDKNTDEELMARTNNICDDRAEAPQDKGGI